MSKPRGVILLIIWLSPWTLAKASGLSEEQITKRLSEVPPGVAIPAADAASAVPAAAAPADNAMMTFAGRGLDIDQQRSATASTMFSTREAAACWNTWGRNSPRPCVLT